MSSGSWTGSREFTVELKSGKQVTAEVSITFSHDSNYGADADGNRGVPMDFTDDVYVCDTLDKDDEGEELLPEEINEADGLLCAAAEDHDWSADMEPDYPDEEDYDDREDDDCPCCDCDRSDDCD
jgi:hypothetical protein